jgi:hypothetical protein
VGPSNKEDMDEQRKKRTVEYQGEILEFYCTDADLDFFKTTRSLDIMWWRHQQESNATFQAEWGDAFAYCETREEMEELKQRMYAHFRAKRRSGGDNRG